MNEEIDYKMYESHSLIPDQAALTVGSYHCLFFTQ